MKLLVGIVFALSTVTTFAATQQDYKWKIISCDSPRGSFPFGNDFDLSRYAFIEINYRSKKSCTLKRITADGWPSTSQEYSYEQLPSPSWHFGCIIDESSSKFNLYVQLDDGPYNYGTDEITIEPTAESGVWSWKHSSDRYTRHAVNQWNYRQECRLTKM